MDTASFETLPHLFERIEHYVLPLFDQCNRSLDTFAQILEWKEEDTTGFLQRACFKDRYKTAAAVHLVCGRRSEALAVIDRQIEHYSTFTETWATTSLKQFREFRRQIEKTAIPRLPSLTPFEFIPYKGLSRDLMVFGRERNATDRKSSSPWVMISPIREADLVRELKQVGTTHQSRIAVLQDENGSYLQLGGGDGFFCLEWHDTKARRHSRGFQTPAVFKIKSVTKWPISQGYLRLRPGEFFTLDQVIETFTAFLQRKPLPIFARWRDITEEVRAKSGVELSN